MKSVYREVLQVRAGVRLSLPAVKGEVAWLTDIPARRRLDTLLRSLFWFIRDGELA